MSIISEETMVAEWLRAEFGPGAHSKPYLEEGLADRGLTSDIILTPLLDDLTQNQYRSSLLDIIRGYATRTKIFSSFPAQVTWHAESVPTDALLSNTLYINDDIRDKTSWMFSSDGTRQPRVMAGNLKTGKVINPPCLEIAELVRQGKTFDRIILVSDKTRTIVIEGHHRLTAYALAEDALPPTMPIIRGVVANLSGWPLY